MMTHQFKINVPTSERDNYWILLAAHLCLALVMAEKPYSSSIGNRDHCFFPNTFYSKIKTIYTLAIQEMVIFICD